MSKYKPEPPYWLTTPELARAVLEQVVIGTPPSDAPFLKPEHFHDYRDRDVWRAAMELEAEGISRELISLAERLKRTSTLQDVNWPDYLLYLVTGPTGSGSYGSFEFNAATIYDNWRRSQAYLHHVKQAGLAIDLTIPFRPADALPNINKAWTVGDILKAEIPAPRGPWPGIIPPGLTVIGARPKFGKSLLMLQVSAAIGTGGMLFGQPVEQAPVLYYALEDSVKRLQERLTRLEIPPEAQIKFLRQIDPLHTGGMQQIIAAASDHGMIVIDTISRALPGQDFNRDAKVFGDVLGKLQTTALDNHMSIVTVVHTRKPNGFEHDPVDDVLGSTQMTAAADCVLAIYRNHAASGAGGQSVLRGRARDMEDIDLTMQFDPATVSWQLVGKTEEVRQTESQSEILVALKELGKARASTVAQAVGALRSNTSTRLRQLWREGKVRMELVDNIPHYYLESQEDRQ